MIRIRVLRCPHCGRYQATAAKNLQCKFCSKSVQIIGKDGLSRVQIVAVVTNAREAAHLVLRFNSRR